MIDVLKFRILWIADNIIYARNSECGDEMFNCEKYPDKKVGDIIEIKEGEL